jgi:hypothetical protein
MARRILAVIFGLAAAVVAFGVLAPFVNVSSLSGPVRSAIEQALGREIQFSKVHLTLFSGPGFSLEDVIIAEDPRYGREPFAWVPSLQARIRIDKLLLGHLRLSSLRLEQPALNLVKRSDGTWNVVDLVQRLSALHRMPLNLFPTFEVSDGRIDFKFGTRKTTFYLLESDLSIYPERSGTLSVRFSGSPARTDRAGNGFGHMHGTADWHVNTSGPAADQLEADVTLDPSNLSELTTLFAGQDIGVHGSISARARIAGPLTALRVAGDLRLGDVHRWDLLPSTGEYWRVQYAGGIDWAKHTVELHTISGLQGETNPVSLEFNVADFLARPNWSLVARLDQAPVEKLLPLGHRMGLSLPEDVKIQGIAKGAVVYSSENGLSGTVSVTDATATLANVPPLHTDQVNAKIFSDRIHFDPATIDTPEGSLHASGEYYLVKQECSARLEATGFSVDALKGAINAWFGTPPLLTLLKGGRIEGSFDYLHQRPAEPEWSGRFRFFNATVRPQGLAAPLTKAEGDVEFGSAGLEVSHFASTLGENTVRASYRYIADARRPEGLHIEMPAADLNDFEKILEPTVAAQDFLERLHVTKRSIPDWLASRNMEGDLAVAEFSVGGTSLGAMTSRFVWAGAELQVPAMQIKLPEGTIRGHGLVDLASYTPRSRFAAEVVHFPWRGGVLSAEGTFATSGLGIESLRNLRATGTFEGSDLSFSDDDEFDRIAGQFDFKFADGWPDLKLSAIQASDGIEAWNGVASSNSDGKLIMDLEHAGRQRRVVSTLEPASGTTVSSVAPGRTVVP